MREVKKAAKRPGRRYADQKPYHCRFCGQFHVAPAPGRNLRAEKRRQDRQSYC